MKFQDALQEFIEGRCEGIKMICDVNNLFVIDDLKLYAKFSTCIHNILFEEWELVNPKPQYEEAEVVGYYHVASGDISRNPWHEDEEQIELKGILKREIKPKVKHREEIGFAGTSGIFTLTEKVKEIKEGTKLYAEWED